MVKNSGTLSYVGDGKALLGTFVGAYLVRLLVADQLRVSSLRTSIAEVAHVCIGRGEYSHVREHVEAGPTLNIKILDSWMSGTHAQLDKENGKWVLTDCSSKNGTYLNGEHTEKAILCDGDLIQTGNSTFLFRDKVERSHLEPADIDSSALHQRHQAMQTLSPPLGRMMADMMKVADSTVSIILGGETGTGKEVSARFIHQASSRRGNFVAVNCGALPANLVESELFGHRKGAFSGATKDKVGLIESSNHGTLFLDEVAELPLETQVKLLRTLQEREVVPVGATSPIPVDMRVVAASHADLEELVEEDLFRSDLYARLAGVCFKLPALRDRREDLGLLIQSLLKRIGTDTSIKMEREVMWAFALYDWPRNIRELEQALRAAVVWADDGVLRLRHLPPAIAGLLSPLSKEVSEDGLLRAQLISLLRTHHGNVSAIAREMGKARVQIRRWCKRFDLDIKNFR